MTQEEVIQQLISKTLQELGEVEKPVQQSRAWTSPNGYKHLVQWSNAVLLRYWVRMFTNNLPKSEYRKKAQLDDCARSVVRNIEEGWKRATTATYLDFIGYSKGLLRKSKVIFGKLVRMDFYHPGLDQVWQALGLIWVRLMGP